MTAFPALFTPRHLLLHPISPPPVLLGITLFGLVTFTMAAPANVHVSSHPLLQAKLSQIRSASTTTRETRNLVHEISTILGVEAFASGWKATGTGKTVSVHSSNSMRSPITPRL